MTKPIKPLPLLKSSEVSDLQTSQTGSLGKIAKRRRKKAAVFDPYLDTIGGGEVYTSSVIGCLHDAGYQVSLFWKDEAIKDDIKKYLGINIDKAVTDPKGYDLFTKKGHWFQKRQFTHQYDVAFFLSDGSIPLLFSKNNILHFQIPFKNVNGTSILNRFKLSYIHQIICNSQFTKRVIDEEYQVVSKVIYPPVSIKQMRCKKQNIILGVGRFTETLHNKRQDILVSAFKDLIDNGLQDWKLVLIGSSKEGKEMVKELQKQAAGYPIKIKTDVQHAVVEEAYFTAKIFWHAAGFGVDQNEHPELVEHFGIATAEAMSAGCIPVVINKGGQPEIVSDEKNGLLWNTVDELKNNTLRLIKDQNYADSLVKNALESSKKFSKEHFRKSLYSILR